MTRWVWTATLALAVGLSVGVGRAGAQPRLGAPPPPPGTSPYLNLLRGGAPAINYYGLVRPQQNFQGAIQNLQFQQAGGQDLIGARDEDGLPVTGVPVGFMNHSVYFMNLGPAGPGRIGFLAGPGVRIGQIGAGVPAPRGR